MPVLGDFGERSGSGGYELACGSVVLGSVSN